MKRIKGIVLLVVMLMVLCSLFAYAVDEVLERDGNRNPVAGALGETTFEIRNIICREDGVPLADVSKSTLTIAEGTTVYVIIGDSLIQVPIDIQNQTITLMVVDTTTVAQLEAMLPLLQRPTTYVSNFPAEYPLSAAQIALLQNPTCYVNNLVDVRLSSFPYVVPVDIQGSTVILTVELVSPSTVYTIIHGADIVVPVDLQGSTTSFFTLDWNSKDLTPQVYTSTAAVSTTFTYTGKVQWVSYALEGDGLATITGGNVNSTFKDGYGGGGDFSDDQNPPVDPTYTLTLPSGTTGYLAVKILE